jgi:hypothetical protein
VALSLALVLTLVMLSSESARVRAAAVARGGPDGTSRDVRDAGERPLVRIAEPDADRRIARVEQNPEDPNRSTAAATPARATTRDALTANPANGNSNHGASAEASAGAGSGRTATPPKNSNLITPAEAVPPTSTPATENAAGGIGRSGAQTSGVDTAAGGSVVSRPITPPPWSQPASWRDAVEQAAHALQSGRVLDESRDLVRGYFDPAATDTTSRP